MSEQGEVGALKNSIYVDKVYSGIAELRRRTREPKESSVDLRLSELRVFSQNGEDGILIESLRNLETDNCYFVEFGVGDGWSCNTRILAEVLGWGGLYLEIDPDAFNDLDTRYRNCKRISTLCAEVTPKSINQLFESAEVPEKFGVLSIDIDGQDYWVWDALDTKFKPDVVITEVNLNFGLEKSVTERVGVNQYPLTETFGSSVRAMQELGARKGYELVHIDIAGVNAFFVLREHLTSLSFVGLTDRSSNYGLRGRFHDLERLYQGNEIQPRATVEV